MQMEPELTGKEEFEDARSETQTSGRPGFYWIQVRSTENLQGESVGSMESKRQSPCLACYLVTTQVCNVKILILGQRTRVREVTCTRVKLWQIKEKKSTDFLPKYTFLSIDEESK